MMRLTYQLSRRIGAPKSSRWKRFGCLGVGEQYPLSNKMLNWMIGLVLVYPTNLLRSERPDMPALGVVYPFPINVPCGG